jgi:hypothetical protein
VAVHEFLGKGFAAFQPGAGGGGPDDGDGPESGVRGQKVDNAFYQGLLRAHYNHPDTFRAAKFADTLKIQRRKVNIDATAGGAGISGSDI